jgi:hypothetical protein
MTLYSILIIFLVIALGMWLVYRYVPEPPKTILLWIIGVAVVIFLLNVMGLLEWLKTTSV